jgi:endonuclease/exonuclease/phosphatase (EEP) superfamily protein YafD
MKRNITLLSRTLMLTIRFTSLVLLLGASNFACAFLPETPLALTIFDHNEQVYQGECPNLIQVKHFSPAVNKLTLPFTILNWNIYKQQNVTWKEKLQEWVETSDLITLQEAKHSQDLIDFSRSQNLNYYQNHAFNLSGYIYGVNTLSHNHASHVCGTRYYEPWIHIPKTGIATVYPIDQQNDSLLVINLHAVNFTFTSVPLKEQLLPYLQLIDKHKGPIIFSGDFNTWSDARSDHVDNILTKNGFKETSFNDDQRLTIFGLPLDHIYFRGLKVISADSLATDASDHSPQIVTFDIE